jgi:hypothetical protein
MSPPSTAKIGTCGLRLVEECGGRLLVSARNMASKADLCLLDGTGQRYTLNHVDSGGAFMQLNGGLARKDKHMVDLGCLPGGTRALACSLQKLWWLYPRILSDVRTEPVPVETQFLLLELNSGEDEEDGMYALVLPLVNEKTRSSLKGGPGGKLYVNCETGCSQTPVEPQVDNPAFHRT